MRLSEVLKNCEVRLVNAAENAEITGIEYDSRRVGKGSLFAALAGEHTDGNRYISQALENGAEAILTASEQPEIKTGQIIAADTRKVLREIAENFYGCPEKKLELIAVTGTNGKTTIAQIISHAMKKLNKRCGVLGTVAYDLVSRVIPAPLTTPESPDYQGYLAEMADSNAEFAVCEFSSQALAQQRVVGDNVKVAIFTNLSRDHLDNHGSMENYFLAKKRLFDRLPAGSTAVINTQDGNAEKIVSDTSAKVIRVGFGGEDDFRIVSSDYEVRATRLGIEAYGKEYTITSALIGEYNAMNLLEAIAALYASGFAVEEVISAVSDFKGAGGRLERIDSSDGRVAFVDYAHTDDALDNALTVLRKITRGRLIAVFGCGGDRDRGKRPLMAEVAEKKADILVITNDNPRTEDPEQIMNDIVRGLNDKSAVKIEFDRAEAINYALSIATRDDVVLIAGKGHEDYQILGTGRIHFDDREVVRECFSGKCR